MRNIDEVDFLPILPVSPVRMSFERKDVPMNRRKFVRSLTLGAASLAAVATFSASAASVGETVALPAVTLIDGTVLMPEHWKGKVLIVERFATWCPFCKVQNPKLEKLLKMNKAKGLEVLALSIDKNAAEVPKYMQQHGYTFSAAMMTPEWQRVLGDVKGLPVIWVIGRDGKLKQVESGELLDEDVAELARWL
jgi:thiol-disulfide isomerase/thioredoxin